MICKKFDIPFTSENWQRINMRRVEHLIGAEMIHNLYNRHWPQINSIRFRNTVTYFDNGLVESFAPVAEWKYLQKILALRFRKLDPVLIREIHAILHPKYELVNELMGRLQHSDIKSLSDEDLALLLLELLDIPLGEIYKLNVVQIEYGLTRALNDILSEYEPNVEDRSLLLSKLIAPGKMTMSQQEELAFDEVRQQMRDNGIQHPYDDPETKKLFLRYVEEYAPKHCAYGELAPSAEDFLNKILFLEQTNSPINRDDLVEEAIRAQYKSSRDLLKKINEQRLNVLCPLMAEIGDFRDKNKAKLGETVAYRHVLVAEIVRRKNLSEKDARFYLKSEFVNLLLEGTYIDNDELQDRQNQGVHFVRAEYLELKATKPELLKMSTTSRRLSGVCASPGDTVGRVVIVNGKKDIDKVQEGDVMVAIGTDFDVLEAMYRSSAIITEEGGLLSHASVVSRELNKPCLIGVNSATKILKSGQTVKVNATEGFLEVKL